MTTYYAVRTSQGDYRTDCLSDNFNQTKEAALDIARMLVTDNWDEYFYATEYEDTSPEDYFKAHKTDEALDLIEWTIVPISETAYYYLSETLPRDSPTPYDKLPKELEDTYAY